MVGQHGSGTRWIRACADEPRWELLVVMLPHTAVMRLRAGPSAVGRASVAAAISRTQARTGRAPLVTEQLSTLTAARHRL